MGLKSSCQTMLTWQRNHAASSSSTGTFEILLEQTTFTMQLSFGPYQYNKIN